VNDPNDLLIPTSAESRDMAHGTYAEVKRTTVGKLKLSNASLFATKRAGVSPQ
jgi:hypothetical protein